MEETHIPAGEFKAHCLRLLDRVKNRRRPLVITKRGKPVARVVPLENAPPRNVFGCMKDFPLGIGDEILQPAHKAWEDADGGWHEEK
jgi:prevent-host-death family protein